MANNSLQIGTSTRVDTANQNHEFEMAQHDPVVASGSNNRSRKETLDQKMLRRLEQNREAARKSRLKKKAYIRHLEHSQKKLMQLEEERKQGKLISSSAGALAFNVEYSQWSVEHNRQINQLRAAVCSYVTDADLRAIVENAVTHFEDVFRLKGIAAKADVFHILSGMWQTPAEQCFMWIGGFRSSEILKVLINQLEPLTQRQLIGFSNLMQSSEQTEDALSQGLAELLQSLALTLPNGFPFSSPPSGNLASCMGPTVMAVENVGMLEAFVHQADSLRQQTLRQMHHLLTVRQSARAVIAINDHFARLQALGSMCAAQPNV